MAGTSTLRTSVRTQAPVCIEVYPHPVVIGLFGLGRILKFKGGDLTTRQAAFTELLDHLEAIHTLSLVTSQRWSDIRSVTSTSPRQCDLDRIEDEVDAVLCATLPGSGTTNPQPFRSTATWNLGTSSRHHHRPTHRLPALSSRSRLRRIRYSLCPR